MEVKKGAEYSGIIVPLIDARVQRRWSQRELDERAGFADGQVAKWESYAKRPSPFHLLCWAQQSLGTA